MAKDAKGHGSEKRDGSDSRDPFNYHQHRIAVDTLKMPKALAGVMGGPSQAEAESILRSKFGYGDKDISALKGGAYPADTGKGVTDKQAADALAGGGAKSAQVGVHPSMVGMEGQHVTGPVKITGVTSDGRVRVKGGIFS